MEEGKKEKSRAARIIDGEIKPEPHEVGLLNLRKRVPFNEMPPEKFKEIARKGGEAVQKLHGEKRTAKEALTNILTLKVSDEIAAAADIDPSIYSKLKRDNPDATLYDLIQAVAVGRALEGNIKAAEYVRDTHGDKPVERVEVTDNITTEADRELMRGIAERLKAGDVAIVADSSVVDERQPEG